MERPDSGASGTNTSKMFPHGLTGDSRRSCLEHLVSQGHRAVLSGAPEGPGHMVHGWRGGSSLQVITLGPAGRQRADELPQHSLL